MSVCKFFFELLDFCLGLSVSFGLLACLSVCLFGLFRCSAHLFACVLVRVLLFACLLTCVFVCVWVSCACVRVFVCLCVCLFVRLSVCLFV